MTHKDPAPAAAESVKEKLWTRDFIIIMIACSGISFCNYFFSQTMPLYAQRLTGTTVFAGLITTIFTFAALATRPLTGILVEKVGRIRLLIFGAVVCAVACFLYQFSSAILVLIVIRAFHGIGFGIHTTAGGAVPADIIPKSRLSEGIGIFGLYGTIASALGPGIGLSIIGNGDFKSFLPLFYSAATVAIVCAGLELTIRYEKRNKTGGEPILAHMAPEPCDEKPLPKTYLGFEAGVFAPALVLILAYIGLSSLTSFLSLFAKSHQLGNIGLYFTINAAGMVCSRLFVGKIADRRGADVIVIPSLLVIAVCVALVPLIHRPLFLFMLGVPIGFCQGAFTPTVYAMMFKRCTAGRRGSVSAAYFSSLDIGFGAGAFLFGVVAQSLGFSVVYWGAAFCVLAAAAMYIIFLRKKRPLSHT